MQWGVKKIPSESGSRHITHSSTDNNPPNSSICKRAASASWDSCGTRSSGQGNVIFGTWPLTSRTSQRMQVPQR